MDCPSLRDQPTMDEAKSEENETSITRTTSTSSSVTDLGPGGCPGDGVCPSASSLLAVFKCAYDSWATPASQITPDEREELFDMNMFVQLMTKFPPFEPPPLKDIIVPGAVHADLIVDLVMSLETCMLPECTQREKKILITYLSDAQPGVHMKWCVHRITRRSINWACHFIHWSVGRVWSFPGPTFFAVVGWRSSRVLAKTPQSFDQILVLQMTSGKVYYAPFMLRSSLDLDAEMDQSTTIEPHSANAFKLITEYCMSQNLLHECALALVIVLCLISPDRSYPKLLEWSSDVEAATGRSVSINPFGGLWGVLDQCITMGCTLGAVDSLLCSAFFDPALPCNVVGAQWIGTRSALELDHHKYDYLITAIRNRRPDLGALWLGIISTGQTRQIINIAIESLPPINLVVGNWTGVVQSFLQVQYDISVGPNRTISQASEFSTAYYVQPEINHPLCRTSPFGRTLTNNTSLQVREHLEHYHRPQQARFFQAGRK